MKIKYFILIVFISFVCFSCNSPQTYQGLFPADVARKLVFITGLDETLSVIDPDNLEIYNNVGNTETVPNHLYFRNNKLYVTNSLSNSIQQFSYSGDGIVESDRLYLGNNSNPWMIISDGSSRAYVPCFVSNDIALIDLDTFSVIDADPTTPDIIDRISAGEGPEGGRIVDSKLYVTNTAWSQSIFGFKKGSVSVFNTTTNQLINTLWIDDDTYTVGHGSNPQGIISFPELNELHVVCTGVQGDNDGKIIIINTLTDTIDSQINIGGSPGWSSDSIDRDNKIVYLTGEKGIHGYNYETKVILGKEDADSGWYLWQGEDSDSDFYSGIYFDEDQGYLFVSLFTDNKILVLEKDMTDEYQKIMEMETFNGPQGNILQLP